jgi:uncharacterized protein
MPTSRRPLSDIPSDAASDIDTDALPGALSEAELAELAEQLAELDAMPLGMVEGYLTAVLVNPQPVAPAELFPWILDPELGEDEPGVEDADLVDAMLLLLGRFIADLDYELGHDLVGFEPLFLRAPAFADSTDWCNGFLLGTRFGREQWQAVANAMPELFEAIAMLADEEAPSQRDELERLVGPSVLGLAIELGGT